MNTDYYLFCKTNNQLYKLPNGQVNKVHDGYGCFYVEQRGCCINEIKHKMSLAKLLWGI